MDVVGGDEDDEDEVQQDEDEQTEVEKHQLLHLADGDEQDCDPDQCKTEEGNSKND